MSHWVALSDWNINRENKGDVILVEIRMRRYAELLKMLSQKIKNPDELISNIVYALELADVTVLTQTYRDEEVKVQEKEKTSWYIR